MTGSNGDRLSLIKLTSNPLHPPPHPPPQAQRVYVGNLSWNVDREQLRQHMAEAGEVTFAEVLTEPSGRSKVRVWMARWLVV